MDCNVRPESMERITTKALADAFIEEQVKLVREQVATKKFFSHSPAVLTHQLLLLSLLKLSASSQFVFTLTMVL